MSDESQSLDTPQGPSRQDLENALRTELVKQQDILYGIVGGLAAAIVAALLWALITVSTKYQIGYMAIGVGLIVGVGVRIFGAGVDNYFGIAAALLALFGCALGNVLSQLAFAADQQSMSYWEALGYMNVDLIVALLKDGFNPMDVLFYGLAVSAAYRISIRKVDEELEVAVATGKVSPPPYSQYRLPAVIIFAGIIVSVFVVFYENTSGAKTYTYDSGGKRSIGETSDGREVGPWEHFYENGNTMAKGFYVNGNPDSTWTYYDDDGTLTRSGKYRKGLQEGEWTWYNSDGSVDTKGTYRYGRQVGLWTSFYPNGNVMQKGSYVVDLQDGEWESYFENGQLSSKGSFDYGDKIGVWTRWTEQGMKLEELGFADGYSKILNEWMEDGKPVITNGNGNLKEYYSPGVVRESGLIRNGFRDGAWKTYFPGGKVREEGEYRNMEYFVKNSWTESGEVLVSNGMGKGSTFYEDGSVAMSGEVVNGVKVGEWTSRLLGSDSVGTRVNFKGGKMNGDYMTYRETGEVSMKGLYKDDLRDGECTWFKEGGAVESNVVFVNGKKEGAQVFYNAYGDLLKTEVYKGGKLVETKVE